MSQDSSHSHWSRKRVENRRLIREAALALFEEKGFEATTMMDIEARSGVSRRSIYRYFRTKEGIFFAHQRARFERFQALSFNKAPGESPYDAVRRACLTLADEFMADREAFIIQQTIINNSKALLPLELQLTQEWDDLMIEALKSPSRPIEHTQALAGALLGMLRALLKSWMEGGARQDLRALGEQSLDLFERGFELRPRG